MCVLKSSHRLDGNSLLTCNSTLAVQILFHHREMCVLMLRISHCPDGIFTCFALMLAGRRCLHQRHGELLIVHHHWQLGLRSACSRSKVPITPMGKGLVDMSSSILIFYDGCCLELPGWSTCHLRLKLQKFPSPRWEKALLTCPVRFSSFMMGAASNYQAGVRAICA